MKWFILDCLNGIRTSETHVDSPFGFACIRRYESMRDSSYLAYVAVVVQGNSVSDANFGANLGGALEFTQHPFRTLESGDYWYGTEIQSAKF